MHGNGVSVSTYSNCQSVSFPHTTAGRPGALGVLVCVWVAWECVRVMCVCYLSHVVIHRSWVMGKSTSPVTSTHTAFCCGSCSHTASLTPMSVPSWCPPRSSEGRYCINGWDKLINALMGKLYSLVICTWYCTNSTQTPVDCRAGSEANDRAVWSRNLGKCMYVCL